MSSTINSSCPVCCTTKKLLRCQGCKVMPYCSREHQVIDRSDHKDACNSVKKTQKNLEDEERKLRALPPDDFMMPANIFEEGVGHFWGIHPTRPYMRARFALVEALLKIKTFNAVQEALNHIMDMLRLCRGDNMGVRDLVPALYLRLGKDQECYDFIKWYATTGSKGDYDWGDMDEPYLDVKGADLFEPVDIYTGRFFDLSHAIGVALIKIRLLRDIKSLQNSTFLCDRVPQELVNKIRGELVSPIVAQKKNIMNGQDQDEVINLLESQFGKLYASVKKSNKYFWPALLAPECYLAARPTSYSMGSKEHAQLTLQYYYDAFVETSGAIDMIRKQVQKDILN